MFGDGLGCSGQEVLTGHSRDLIVLVVGTYDPARSAALLRDRHGCSKVGSQNPRGLRDERILVVSVGGVEHKAMRPCFDGLDERSGGELGIGRWIGSSMENRGHRGGFELAD